MEDHNTQFEIKKSKRSIIVRSWKQWKSLSALPRDSILCGTCGRKISYFFSAQCGSNSSNCVQGCVQKHHPTMLGCHSIFIVHWT